MVNSGSNGSFISFIGENEGFMIETGLFQTMLLAYGLPLFLMLLVVLIIGFLLGKIEDN